MVRRSLSPIGTSGASSEPGGPSIRRALLTAAVAAGGALAVQAFVRPAPVAAADVSLGVTNYATAATTIRTSEAVSTAKAIIGMVTYTGVGNSTAGVQGQSSALHGNSVFGYALSGSSSKGVWGRTADGRGVYGEATGTESVNYGVYGETKSESGIGVYGRATSVTGFTVGVYGDATSPVGTGVFGRATATANPNYGVYGLTNSSGGHAGYFSGKVHVQGVLSKSSGTFLIDHPMDPANRTLAHSFVEAPEMLNVYRGTVTLDPKGAATVRLPRYFRSLNTDFGYQLTPVGAQAPGLHVARRIERNSFRIAGGAPGQEVCWIVTGVRQDAWAKAHPLRVDRAKRGRDRGRYLNPEVFGQPRGAAIHRPPDVGRSRRST